jgi:hypothetical protein
VLAADPGAVINQTPGWFEATLSTMRATDASRMYLLEDGRRLVLPMVRRSPLPGLTLDSSVHFGDLLATGGVRAEDVGYVVRDLQASRQAARIRLISHYGNADKWEAGRPAGASAQPRSVHVLDLDGGFSRVWQQRFDKPARRSVRRAEKSGLVVERDTTGRLTSTFYSVYREWLAEKASESNVPRWLAGRVVTGRQEPLELFQAMATELGDACRQWVAWHAGEPVAVNISFVHGEHALTWRGFSRKELAAPVRANNLLQKLAIEDACEAGCRFYSMGQSGGVPSLERFKEGMGATPRPAPEYLIERLPVSRLIRLRQQAEAAAYTTLGAAATWRRKRAGSASTDPV